MKKGYIIFSVIVSLVVILYVVWTLTYPGTSHFICDKDRNICEKTYENIFKYTFNESIDIDINNIISADVEEKMTKKRAPGTIYIEDENYDYYLNLYYNSNGKSDTYMILRSRSYSPSPAGKYDQEIIYFKKIAAELNQFFKDEKQKVYEVYDFGNGTNTFDYWYNLLMFSIFFPFVVFALVIPILLFIFNIIFYFIPIFPTEFLDSINNFVYKDGK